MSIHSLISAFVLAGGSMSAPVPPAEQLTVTLEVPGHDTHPWGSEPTRVTVENNTRTRRQVPEMLHHRYGNLVVERELPGASGFEPIVLPGQGSHCGTPPLPIPLKTGQKYVIYINLSLDSGDRPVFPASGPVRLRVRVACPDGVHESNTVTINVVGAGRSKIEAIKAERDLIKKLENYSGGLDTADGQASIARLLEVIPDGGLRVQLESIARTNKELADESTKGRFVEDLFNRTDRLSPAERDIVRLNAVFDCAAHGRRGEAKQIADRVKTFSLLWSSAYRAATER